MSTNAGATPVGDSGTPPKKKKKLLGCLGIIVLAIILFAGCSALMAGGSDTPEPTQKQSSAPKESKPVQTEEATNSSEEDQILSANSSGPASVLHGPLGSGSTVDISGPWEQIVTVDPTDPESLMGMTVQDKSGAPSAAVSCKIVDGEGTVVDEANSTGAYSIATCNSEMKLW